MKSRFDRARDLYRENFLPLIRSQNKTESAEKCQRLRDDHEQRLGCSRCPQRACRNDNRLAKTMLMAALVPEAKPFKGLTVKRLVHLNHGTIASPIPGAEVQVAAARLREWATQVGALRIGEQADPEIAIHLSGVDLEPILAQAAEADTPGARKNAMRRLLFEALELQSDSTVVEDEVSFSGTRRPGRVRYGNVREMDDAALTCPSDFEWQVIIDYPFDDKGHGPEEDSRRIEKYREGRAAGAAPNPTVVWLPTFFSHSMERELGQLVVLEHILDGDSRRYVGHLRVEDQGTTRADLTSLRAQKQALVKRTLAQAYGLTIVGDTSLLDQSRTVEEHLKPLLDDLEIRSVLAGTLKEGFKQLIDALLAKRYPHHPRYDGLVTTARMERVLGLVEKLLDERGRRLLVERAEQKDLRAYADPLGITETGDVATLLREQPFKDLEQRRQQQGLDTPTVGAVAGLVGSPADSGSHGRSARRAHRPLYELERANDAAGWAGLHDAAARTAARRCRAPPPRAPDPGRVDRGHRAGRPSLWSCGEWSIHRREKPGSLRREGEREGRCAGTSEGFSCPRSNRESGSGRTPQMLRGSRLQRRLLPLSGRFRASMARRS